MSKQLTNPLEVTILFEDDNPLVPEINAHYGVTCEHGDLGRKGMPVKLTSPQKAQIINFTKNVILPQIKANEGIGGD